MPLALLPGLHVKVLPGCSCGFAGRTGKIIEKDREIGFARVVFDIPCTDCWCKESNEHLFFARELEELEHDIQKV